MHTPGDCQMQEDTDPHSECAVGGSPKWTKFSLKKKVNFACLHYYQVDVFGHIRW